MKILKTSIIRQLQQKIMPVIDNQDKHRKELLFQNLSILMYERKPGQNQFENERLKRWLQKKN